MLSTQYGRFYSDDEAIGRRLEASTIVRAAIRQIVGTAAARSLAGIMGSSTNEASAALRPRPGRREVMVASAQLHGLRGPTIHAFSCSWRRKTMTIKTVGDRSDEPCSGDSESWPA